MRSWTILIAICLLYTTSSALKTSDLVKLDKALKSALTGPMLPTAVRLAFHDCVGGCNGCINLDDPDNAGLEVIIDALENVYAAEGLSDIINRSDFWAYSSVYALNRMIRVTNGDCTDNCLKAPDLVFQTGRVDCPTAPSFPDEEHLPAATMGLKDTLKYFKDEFRFDAQETVALMGAHTIGRASRENSGYRGAWIGGEASRPDNRYYQVLIDSSLGWTQVDVNRRAGDGEERWQWNAKQLGMMLNPDMCLYKDIQVDEDGESSCGYDDCAVASTADLVIKYADDNDLWMTDFSAVFAKVLAHGNFTLVDLED